MPQLLGRAICKTPGLSPVQAQSSCSALWDVHCVGFLSCLVLWSRSVPFLSRHHTALSFLGWKMSNCGKESESQREKEQDDNKEMGEWCIMNGVKWNKKVKELFKERRQGKGKSSDCLYEMATGENCSKRTRDWSDCDSLCFYCDPFIPNC